MVKYSIKLQKKNSAIFASFVLIIGLLCFELFIPHRNQFTKLCEKLNNQTFSFEKIRSLNGFCLISSPNSASFQKCYGDSIKDIEGISPGRTNIITVDEDQSMSTNNWACEIDMQGTIMKTHLYYNGSQP